MVSKENLGVAPEWIQWQLLEESVASVEWVLSLLPAIANSDSFAFAKFVPYAIARQDLERIAEHADCKITLDPPRRMGELSFQKTLGAVGVVDVRRDVLPNNKGTQRS